MNRNDITVAVGENGEMWIAQGNPAIKELPDDCLMETGLYHSQLYHRCAALTPEGWDIMLPSEAKKQGYPHKRFPDLNRRKATGTPLCAGWAFGAPSKESIVKTVKIGKKMRYGLSPDKHDTYELKNLSPADLTKAYHVAKGVYQFNLLDGKENWSGSSLVGTAATYGGWYAKSRANLLERLREVFGQHYTVDTRMVFNEKTRRWSRELCFFTGDFVYIFGRYHTD